MPGLSPRDRRALTLGALVVSLAVLGAGVPRGVARVSALRERVAEKTSLVERAELVAARPSSTPLPAEPAPRLSPSVVERWAATNRVEVIRVTPAPAGAVRLEALSDLAGVVGLLQQWRATELSMVAADSGRGRDQRLKINVVLDPLPADSAHASAILSRNVFRTDRRPPERRFEPGSPPMPTAPPVRFVIEGVVRGASPSVIVRTAANDAARVLAVGDSVTGYRLMALRGDSAVFVGFGDTVLVAVGGKPK